LPGKQRPSFLKRQKEQKRLARAAAKREQRHARKLQKAEQQNGQGQEFELLDGPVVYSGDEVDGASDEETGT
jgi:hypothetical protein